MSRLNKIFKSKTGFTLVELCIVMAVTAVVASLVVMFMFFATKQKNDLTEEAKVISDISAVQKEVNEWIKKYDSTNYTITSSGTGNNILTATTTTTPTTSYTLSFDKANKKILEGTNPKTEKMVNVNSIHFELLTGKSAIRVTVNYGNNKQQDIIFPLFSNVRRTRRVEKWS